MELQRVNLQQAKILEKIGFDWPVNDWGLEIFNGETGAPAGMRTIYGRIVKGEVLDKGRYRLPTICLVFKWLREQHDINVMIESYSIGSSEYCYIYTVIYITPEEADKKRPQRTHKMSYAEGGGSYSGGYNTYEQAEFLALEFALNYLNNLKSI